ncbi:GTPase [Tuwongella immobilis]|uniref:TrmE-type G domain-containing protein n=1 Tax=Tuwongella immobilis TaxID=692036 RepID=A0A6C2YR57_9BACT|nr:GTPase [Tuwongella immobilis]VIP03639.1 trna modification gtpase : Small GTP-binding protein domain protein OS=Singulisphaera acidiphila (strain ATCC BAA-1392 / DSM 18658 / VKM B-2454 / MOB10) GN=Sinac_6522 PE=4 SV=1: TrmE_N: MMR_HSR1 [Tuwongella immobilis]VTS04646.1 trna modification gtpase : Small GTP-binding protein domain protein OS=Singulisphaera acidiphila (strain ATCC BAA-1392 / DSM 18658 / VKM B-2454 / MOB10) GN=Sinac_6522 PE=4 SV=1: TrmE_N: MMR_HSR1 [Tuwongella immobilis]
MSNCLTMQTRVAQLTPPGSAAIATIALVGPESWRVVQTRFATHLGNRLPDQPTSGRTWFGRLGDAIADEVILTVSAETPIPRVEIHCHGGRKIVELLMTMFESAGCIRCRWQELLQLQHPVHLGSAIVHDAMVALTQATTTRTAAILVDQWNGALNRAIDALDFSLRANDAGSAREQLHELTRWTHLGRHLTRPWSVVIAGPPNVGKSSLINALSGYSRSIVSPIPGTTRDIVKVALALDGWPVEIVDTAGVRDTHDRIEQAGIQLAWDKIALADVCIWMLDNADPVVWPAAQLRNLHTVWVRNKADLPMRWDPSLIPGSLPLVATTGEGLEAVIQAVVSELVPEIPPPGTAIPFTESWCERLEGALTSLEATGCQAAWDRLFRGFSGGK